MSKYPVMFYGYVMKPGWLYEYGLANKCCPRSEPNNEFLPDSDVNFELSTTVNAKNLILTQAGLGKYARFLPLPINGTLYDCLVLGVNNPYTGARSLLLPKERYVKIRELLQVEEEPKWLKLKL